MKLYMTVLGGLLSLTVIPVSKAGNHNVLNNGFLVTAEPKERRDIEAIKQQFPMLSAFIKNGYTAYRITYHTVDADENDIVASGAMFIPDSGKNLPLLNYNHGTIFPSKEYNAPSYLQSGSELNIGKLFAAAGYLVAMPDYIGYGITKDKQHDYGAYHVIANSAIDMLHAVKEFCEQKHINLSGKTFFSGWSEGAAVALATVKKLEEDKSAIQPTVTVVNAGPYYSSGFIDHIFNANEVLKYINSYAWVLATYNRIYKINRPLSYYFTGEAAVALTKDPEAPITHDPEKLFTTRFKTTYKEGRDSALQHAMTHNDLWDWKPLSKIVFCHGDLDDYVPLFNSEKAYQAMQAKAANVSLKIFKGQTHSTGVYQFLMEAYTNFELSR